MFSGITERVEKITRIGKDGIILPMHGWKIEIGESVAVNGACLTAVSRNGAQTRFEISGETMERTNFRFLKRGAPVNLERSLKAGSRISGHFVCGHVDKTVRLISAKKLGTGKIFEFERAREDILVEKGSVALNGVSLTPYGMSSRSFLVSVIGHTLENTNLSRAKVGDRFNLEFDILGKYALSRESGAVNLEFLMENGFL